MFIITHKTAATRTPSSHTLTPFSLSSNDIADVQRGQFDGIVHRVTMDLGADKNHAIPIFLCFTFKIAKAATIDHVISEAAAITLITQVKKWMDKNAPLRENGPAFLSFHQTLATLKKDAPASLHTGIARSLESAASEPFLADTVEINFQTGTLTWIPNEKTIQNYVAALTRENGAHSHTPVILRKIIVSTETRTRVLIYEFNPPSDFKTLSSFPSVMEIEPTKPDEAHIKIEKQPDGKYLITFTIENESDESGQLPFLVESTLLFQYNERTKIHDPIGFEVKYGETSVVYPVKPETRGWYKLCSVTKLSDIPYLSEENIDSLGLIFPEIFGENITAITLHSKYKEKRLDQVYFQVSARCPHLQKEVQFQYLLDHELNSKTLTVNYEGTKKIFRINSQDTEAVLATFADIQNYIRQLKDPK